MNMPYREHLENVKKIAYIDVSVGFMLIPFSFMIFGNYSMIKDAIHVFLIFLILAVFTISRTISTYRSYYIIYKSESLFPVAMNYIVIFSILLYIKISISAFDQISFAIALLTLSITVSFVISLPSFDKVSSNSSRTLFVYIVGVLAIPTVGFFGLDFFITDTREVENLTHYKYYAFLLMFVIIMIEAIFSEYICKNTIKIKT